MKVLFIHGSESSANVFLERVRRKAGSACQIHRVPDAYEAIDYLGGSGQEYADRHRFPLPDVVLLSLEPHTKGALDLLAWLRGEAQFRNLPVGVAEAAGTKADKLCARKLGASAWFTQKPDPKAVLEFCEHLLPSPGAGAGQASK